MKTQLYYFDSKERSKIGNKRGLVSLLILIALSSILYKHYLKIIVPNKFYIFMIFLLLCSALSVQNPMNVKEAVLYGFLVGCVVFGILNSMLLMLKSSVWTVRDALLSFVYGVFTTSLTSYILFNISFLKFV